MAHCGARRRRAAVMLLGIGGSVVGLVHAAAQSTPLLSLMAWVQDARLVGPAEIRQRHANDCGPAALAEGLRFLGLPVRFPDPEDGIVLTRAGCDLAALARAAERHGARPILRLLPPGGLDHVHAPAVLHLREGHFVVFEGRTAAGDAEIVDPSLGRLEQSPRSLARHWSGHVLELHRGGDEP